MKLLKKWLAFAEVAELLVVTERTIKNWLRRPGGSDALLAVRHGKQWRIPMPDNRAIWVARARSQLKELGIVLEPAWERDLKRFARQNERYWPQVYRLYLASSVKALRRGRISFKAKARIDELWQFCLRFLQQGKQSSVEKLGPLVPRHLHRHWPSKGDFEAAKSADARKMVEGERRRLDFVQAVRILRRRNRKPTGANLCPLLHADWLSHINDTGEKLPSGTIKASKPEEIRRAIEADAFAQMHGGQTRRITEHRDEDGRTVAVIEVTNLPGQRPTPIFLDMRQPQEGISLDQFRRRYPLRDPNKPWRSIIGKTYGASMNIHTRDELESATNGDESLD